MEFPKLFSGDCSAEVRAHPPYFILVAVVLLDRELRAPVRFNSFLFTRNSYEGAPVRLQLSN